MNELRALEGKESSGGGRLGGRGDVARSAAEDRRRCSAMCAEDTVTEAAANERHVGGGERYPKAADTLFEMADPPPTAEVNDDSLHVAFEWPGPAMLPAERGECTSSPLFDFCLLWLPTLPSSTTVPLACAGVLFFGVVGGCGCGCSCGGDFGPEPRVEGGADRGLTGPVGGESVPELPMDDVMLEAEASADAGIVFALRK